MSKPKSPAAPKPAASQSLEWLFEDLEAELSELSRAETPAVARPATPPSMLPAAAAPVDPSVEHTAPMVPAMPPAGPPATSPWRSTFADNALAAFEDGALVSASALLSDGDPTYRSTKPYEIPAAELARAAPWREDEAGSQVLTLPVTIDELPGEAYPTAMNPTPGRPASDPFEALAAARSAKRAQRSVQDQADRVPTVKRRVLIPDDARRS